MTSFLYRARRMDGTAVRGTREAGDTIDLARRLRSEGLYLVDVRETSGSKREQVRGPSLSATELQLLTFNLRTLLEAGLPLLTGLQDLEQQSRGNLREIIRGVSEAIAGGTTLAHALDLYPKAFPRSFRAMIAAGESTGRLVESIDRIHTLQEWRSHFRSQMRQILTYPVIVLVALGGLTVLSLVWVIPRFEAILTAAGGEMPLPTRILLGASKLMQTQWPALLAGAVLFAAGVIVMRRIPSSRLWSDRTALRLPVLGPVLTVSSSSQAVHFLGAGIDSGMGLPKSLELAAEVVDNCAVRDALNRVQRSITGGETLARSFESVGIFHPFLCRMVSIGETSGALVSTLERAQRIYDRELQMAIKRFSAALQPTLTVTMGGLLLLLILAILLPLYQIYESIGVGP